jgi:hypothetical protein
MLFLEFDWTFNVYRFRFGETFIGFGRYQERSFATLRDATATAAEQGLAIGRKTDSRTWQVQQATPSGGGLHPSVVDVGTITEYGLTQKLSNPIRCF